MLKTLRNIALGFALLVGTVIVTPPAHAGIFSDDADVASRNLSKAADNFEILRRIVFINGITDKYLLEILGYCSILDQKNQLEVTCKTEDGFKKHFLGLSDNVTYMVEQIDALNVSVFHYRVTFKPQALIPDVDLRANMDALLNDDSDTMNK